MTLRKKFTIIFVFEIDFTNYTLPFFFFLFMYLMMQWLKKRKKNALFEAVEKLKSGKQNDRTHDLS